MASGCGGPSVVLSITLSSAGCSLPGFFSRKPPSMRERIVFFFRLFQAAPTPFRAPDCRQGWKSYDLSRPSLGIETRVSDRVILLTAKGPDT